MSWFHDLVGFSESAGSVRNNLTVDGTTLRSKANGRSFEIGTLTTPTMAELQATAAAVARETAGSLTVSEVVSDAGSLHRNPAHAGAFFQVASQFNLLEMVSPDITPEAGVTGYEGDPTQGPACAIACGAATIYRNWLVPIDGEAGQTRSRQLDMLADVGAELGNNNERLWAMRNGYALATSDVPTDLPQLHKQLRIGVHANSEVTLGDAGHVVTQAFCSALPVAYTSGVSATTLEPLARMILRSSYVATLAAARVHLHETGNPLVFLTLIGGGVFGNPTRWIIEAMSEAFDDHRNAALDVRIVSFRQPNPDLVALLTA